MYFWPLGSHLRAPENTERPSESTRWSNDGSNPQPGSVSFFQYLLVPCGLCVSLQWNKGPWTQGRTRHRWERRLCRRTRWGRAPDWHLSRGVCEFSSVFRLSALPPTAAPKLTPRICNQRVGIFLLTTFSFKFLKFSSTIWIYTYIQSRFWYITSVHVFYFL